ncbi:MAG: Ger(x)C family spore germination protein [Ignavibacteriales bacterium]
MRRWVGALVVAVALAVCCQGCWDKVELEDVAWVQAMGFDKGPEGYLVATLEIGVPRSLKGTGGAGGGGAPVGPHHITISVLSKTGLDALDLVGVSLGRRVSLEHTQAFILGEDLARADIRGLATGMDRFREVRGTAFVFLARGRAEDVLRVATSPLEVSPSRFLQTIIQQHRHTGLFEAVHLAGFIWRIESDAQTPSAPIIALAKELRPGVPTGMGQEFPASPAVGERVSEPASPGDATSLEGGQIPRIGGGPVEVMGTALFSGGQLVGYFDGEETRAMLMLKDDFERGGYAIPDPLAPEYPLALDIRSTGTRVRAVRDGEKVRIDVRVSVEISYIGPRTQTDYTDPRNSPVVERAVEEYLKAWMDRAIAKAKDLQVDPFGFGEHVRRTFWTWPEWEAFAWPTKFPNAVVNTSVRANLARYGLALAPLDVPPGEKVRKQGETR